MPRAHEPIRVELPTLQGVEHAVDAALPEVREAAMKMRLPVGDGIDVNDCETWPEVYVCESQDHGPREASRRLHLVQGPTEYCEGCARWMLTIYKTLGTHCHVETLPLGEKIDRAQAVIERVRSSLQLEAGDQ